MAETTTRTRRKSSGAKEKDFVSRLADAGEEALQRLSDLPGGQRAVTAFNDLRNRVDELGKKVRGLDELEVRVQELEKEVAALKKAKAPARRTTTRKTSTTKTPPPTT
jgi:phage shock protein A